MASYKELKANAEDLMRQAEAAKPAQAAKGAKAKVAKPRKPVAAKYRNAATNEAWSGRGRVPKWLVAELAKRAVISRASSFLPDQIFGLVSLPLPHRS